MSSRLATGTHGEVVVVITTPCPGQLTGTVLLALGNDLRAIEPGLRWLGSSTGRAATQLESLEAHGGNGRVKMRARPVLADEQPTSPR